VSKLKSADGAGAAIFLVRQDGRVARVLTASSGMATPVFAILALAGAALYFMKPDERRRFIGATVAWLRRAAQEVLHGREPYDELDALMLARTARVIATPAVVTLWVLIWLSARTAGADALVAWGSNYAPRTTNGEWWRLVSYAFVHGSVLQLLAAVAAIVPIGMVIERLVGRIAFAAVYLAAAVVAGVVSLWTTSATMNTSGSFGAILGSVGLLLAVIVYGYARSPRLPYSALATKRIGAGMAVLLGTALVTEPLGLPAALAALSTGLAVGLAVAGGVVQGKARASRSALITAAIALVALAVALPLRGTTDARPAIAQIADVESKTASDYAKAVDAYTRGRVNAKALAQLIEMNILPALAADRARIEALRGVPREQAPLVATAREYFDLRDTSWRRRLDGLRGSNMKMLREADRVERAALDAYERLQRTAGS
jgi:membrane associated rhomboid family serine protease